MLVTLCRWIDLAFGHRCVFGLVSFVNLTCLMLNDTHNTSTKHCCIQNSRALSLELSMVIEFRVFSVNFKLLSVVIVLNHTFLTVLSGSKAINAVGRKAQIWTNKVHFLLHDELIMVGKLIQTNSKLLV